MSSAYRHRGRTIGRVADASSCRNTSFLAIYTGLTKISPTRRERSIERTLEAFERFRTDITALHTPDVLDLSLTLGQLKAIYVVAAAGPMSMGTLAEHLGIALSSTSGAVDRLVRRGLLERIDDPTDRRQVIVRATGAALEQIEHLSELGRERMRALLDRLPTDADIKTIERAIGLMADAAAQLNEETR
jgi:DNA-binding MarR family transcriptional regulator